MKTVWIPSIFEWIRILLFIVPLFVASSADSLYPQMKFQIFDNRLTLFEEEILKSLQTTKNFFAREEALNVVMLGLFVSNFIPYLAPIAGSAFVMQFFLSEESDWKIKFSKILATETEYRTTAHDIRRFAATLKTIQTKIKVMSNSNPDMESRKTVASNIHTTIDEMLNFFDQSKSLFKKYPLIGTPLLIELAVFIAYFHPLIRTLNPLEARTPELSCKMHNILLDYRPRTVNARLEKLHFSTLNPRFLWHVSENFSQILFNAMSVEYNQFGYNDTIPGTLACDIDNRRNPRNREQTVILKDDFGADDLFFDPFDSCITDYALLVRHHVEKMFPVALLGQLCYYPPQKTGFGWLTIKLKKLRALRRWDDEPCERFDEVFDFFKCDPFVRLFIDNKKEFDTGVRENDCCFDLDYTHTSEKISKSAWIKIEVWDNDPGLFSKPEQLILRIDGSVDNFLNKGHWDVQLKKGSNYIDTITFWQDEYEEVDGIN